VRVNVTIDSLVLDGLELSRRERDTLVTAIQREMRLVAPGPAAAEGIRALDGGRPPASRVDSIARHVALAVNRAMPATPPSSGIRSHRR